MSAHDTNRHLQEKLNLIRAIQEEGRKVLQLAGHDYRFVPTYYTKEMIAEERRNKNV